MTRITSNDLPDWRHRLDSAECADCGTDVPVGVEVGALSEPYLRLVETPDDPDPDVYDVLCGSCFDDDAGDVLDALFGGFEVTTDGGD